MSVIIGICISLIFTNYNKKNINLFYKRVKIPYSKKGGEIPICLAMNLQKEIAANIYYEKISIDENNKCYDVYFGIYKIDKNKINKYKYNKISKN
ncbi:MAG: hypothetical protein LBM96_06060 [Methanobrevibacter sp.]|nr:hypothetical protein [Candidatus Methanoflexus mossambicus]